MILIFMLMFLINAVNALDSSNWTEAIVGYEDFKIPPEYKNPYSSDFNMYEFDEDIDVFTIRYVNPRIMDWYGYFLEHNSQIKKVKLWFSAGDEFYYIAWRGSDITPTIKEVVKSANKSNYNKTEFYSILNNEYNNYKVVNAIESQRYDYPQNDKGHHSFVSVGSNGINFGVMS